MEEDARKFLIRIVRSITAALLFLLSNMTFGIFFGWLFFEGSPTIGNFIFYAWLLLTLILLLWYLKKIWSVDDLNPDEMQDNFS
ncbi:MAG: hypothetical protein ABW036_14180 [Flavitalea sp.]